MSSVGRWIGQKLCALKGHHNLTVGTKGEWYLVCSNCGHRSAGWQIEERSYRAMSSKQIDEALDELLESELEIHPGG